MDSKGSLKRIAIAVFYFILAAMLNFLVGRIEIHVNPKKPRQENILKGIRMHD